MKITLTQIFMAALLFSAAAAYAQAPAWQWGKRGGTATSLGVNGEDNVIDMATDPNGNVYVLANNNQGTEINVDGHQSMSYYDEISVTSWDCNGNFRWIKAFGGGVSVVARALRTDTLGGVYITGFVLNGNNIPGPEGYAYFDTDTTLPVTNKSMYLIKYDTSGGFQWLNMPQSDTVSIGSVAHSQFVDMAVSPNGDIYAFCFLAPGTYNADSYIVATQSNHVMKYNKDGLFLGGTEMDVHTSGGSGMGGDLLNVQNAHLSRDNHSGRYYLAGYYWSDFGTLSFGSTTFPDTDKFYLAAFDNTGNSLWTKMDAGNGTSGIFYRPAVDEEGGVYIGGQALPGDSFNGYNFSSSGVATVPFVIKVDSNGNNVWGTHGMTTTASVATSAVTYVNNTIGVTGGGSQFQWDSLQFTVPSGLSYIFLTRINATTGSLIGLDAIPSNSLYTGSASITSDKNSNFYVGGAFADQLYPANDTISNIGGSLDWYVAKFGTANCNCTLLQPSFNYNSTGNNTYAFNYTGSTPYSSISWDFGDSSPASTMANPNHTYVASGTYHVCVTVTNDCGSNTSCQAIDIAGVGINNIPGFADISIYPNPTTEEIIIEHAAAGMTLDIYNITGQQMLHTVLKGTKDKVNVRGLSSGVYLMRFTDKEGRQGNSKFVKQ